MQEGSEDEQVCEIHVKSMYIVVEKKVSALLQEFLREVCNFNNNNNNEYSLLFTSSVKFTLNTNSVISVEIMFTSLLLRVV